MRKLFITLAIVGLALTVGQSARADMVNLTIGVPNTALSTFTGPYANVNINLTSSTTATVTFTSDTNGGFIYLMGDGGTADLNVNGTYILGPVTESNGIAGFTPTFKNNTPGTVDGFGNFNLSLNNVDGFNDTATSISFTLTNTSGTWSSAANVLAPNGSGAEAAIHAFACAEPGCSTTSGATATGFGRDGGGAPPPVPEPGTMLLFGVGLLIFGQALRRRLAKTS